MSGAAVRRALLQLRAAAWVLLAPSEVGIAAADSGASVTVSAAQKPVFERSIKTVRSLEAEAPRPGDELLYSVEVVNTGSDASARTVLRDALPSAVRYIPESIAVTSGAAAGRKSDAAGDDGAEYDSVMRSVVVRLGGDADPNVGGSLAVDEKVVVQFRVRVELTARGVVRNQALITASGAHGALVEETRTDADLTVTGAQSTDIAINVCESDRDCGASAPLCDLTLEPGACVACRTSADCKDPGSPDCSTQDHVCECASGGDACRADSDDDGISDAAEERIGSDPGDADSDDDGTLDGAELAPELDSDGDGSINVLDADSDDDGLFDGTEQGFGCDHPGTERSRRRCRPDADGGETTTHPLRRDTDRGGIRDGSEDWNLDGGRDADEGHPAWGHAQDDKARDADEDGLSDELEQTLGSDAADPDSDDDGVPDGAEHNPSEDTDADGLINLRDADSDDDGLFDGTELGRGCEDRGTDVGRGHCVADADFGQNKTSPLRADTDRGGACDGAEDRNRNGRVDDDERNPNAAGDDGDEACMPAADGDDRRLERDVGAPTGSITSAATAQRPDAGNAPDGRLYGGGFSCHVLGARGDARSERGLCLLVMTACVVISRRSRQRRKPGCKH